MLIYPELRLSQLRKNYSLAESFSHMSRFRKNGNKSKLDVKRALGGVSLTLGPGLYGVLGPNGGGQVHPHPYHHRWDARRRGAGALVRQAPRP